MSKRKSKLQQLVEDTAKLKEVVTENTELGKEEVKEEVEEVKTEEKPTTTKANKLKRLQSLANFLY